MNRTLFYTERDPVRCPKCGELGPVGSMFAVGALQTRCGGAGVLACWCRATTIPTRGPLCTCHHHGRVACDGCDDCLPRLEKQVAAAAVARAEEAGDEA